MRNKFYWRYYRLFVKYRDFYLKEGQNRINAKYLAKIVIEMLKYHEII